MRDVAEATTTTRRGSNDDEEHATWKHEAPRRSSALVTVTGVTTFPTSGTGRRAPA